MNVCIHTHKCVCVRDKWGASQAEGLWPRRLRAPAGQDHMPQNLLKTPQNLPKTHLFEKSADQRKTCVNPISEIKSAFFRVFAPFPVSLQSLGKQQIFRAPQQPLLRNRGKMASQVRNFGWRAAAAGTLAAARHGIVVVHYLWVQCPITVECGGVFALRRRTPIRISETQKFQESDIRMHTQRLRISNSCT